MNLWPYETSPLGTLPVNEADNAAFGRRQVFSYRPGSATAAAGACCISFVSLSILIGLSVFLGLASRAGGVRNDDSNGLHPTDSIIPFTSAGVLTCDVILWTSTAFRSSTFQCFSPQLRQRPLSPSDSRSSSEHPELSTATQSTAHPHKRKK